MNLTEELRAANLDTALLDKAADEITRLKHQTALDKTKIAALKTALEEARTDLNELVVLLSATIAAVNQDTKQALKTLAESGERVRQTEQTIKEVRDATNEKILQAVK